MIGIIKYRGGNLASVSNALERLGSDFFISDEPEKLAEANGIIFPGVGHAAAAMEDLRRLKINSWLKSTSQPVLGICLGMQLLFESSDEGETEMLGIFPGHLKKIDSSVQKVPHTGWNQLQILKEHPLLKNITSSQYFYFLHSYSVPAGPFTFASCSYGNPFTAVAAKDNFLGVQFHPEKSGRAGSVILENFLKITEE